MRPPKYGEVSSTEKKFHPGEPVFIIRATDWFALDIIEYYRMLCEEEGCSLEHTNGVQDCYFRTEKWQAEHPLLVKMPD